jgi:hypothetical protein
MKSYRLDSRSLMKNLRGPKVAGFFLVTFLQATPVFAQKSNCAAMAEMAKDVANLRDAGVPKEVVKKRLKRDVPNQEELALAILVLKLVYSTNGTGRDLKIEVLKKCD